MLPAPRTAPAATARHYNNALQSFDDQWVADALARYMKSTRSEAPYLPNNVDYIAGQQAHPCTGTHTRTHAHGDRPAWAVSWGGKDGQGPIRHARRRMHP